MRLEDAAIAVFDWDWFLEWCDSPDGQAIVPGAFLDAWNMLGDAVQHTDDELYRASDKASSVTYEKLFRACNIPAATPSGESYEPEWTNEDVAALRRVFGSGVPLLRERMGGAAV